MIDVQLRAMKYTDIPSAMRLTRDACWNQTAADWQRLLNASPGGCFVATLKNDVVGTVTTITYEGKLSWIGMVLVDGPHRGQGMGTKLLEKAIAHLEGRGIRCLKLDATPAGRPLYEKLGFCREYDIERLSLRRLGVANALHPVAPNVAKVFTLDRAVFGADRSELLTSLSQAAPHFTLTACRGSEIEGYAFGRRGSLADHMGPWIATGATIAAELLDEFLRRSERDLVFADRVTLTPLASELLKSRGFTFQRPLTRMYRGRNDSAGQPHLISAILGPEFG